MAVEIFEIGSEILYQNAAVVPVHLISAQDEDLISATRLAHKALEEFRLKNGFGRAIAAPQVGHSLRFIALNLTNNTYQNDKHSPVFTMFNPEITFKSIGTFLMWDDCLSFPNLMCCVRRHINISVKYINDRGEEILWENCPQDISELLQHEIDHLNGILAVDQAVSPVGVNGLALCDAVQSRDEWLRRKDYFNSLVDYSITSNIGFE